MKGAEVNVTSEFGYILNLILLLCSFFVTPLEMYYMFHINMFYPSRVCFYSFYLNDFTRESVYFSHFSHFLSKSTYVFLLLSFICQVSC